MPFSYQLCSKLCRHNWENPSSAIKTTCTLLTTCSFLLTPLLYNSTALKNHLRCELHFHYQASRGICTHDIQVWTLNSLWLGKYGLKRFIVAKRRNFFTVSWQFRGFTFSYGAGTKFKRNTRIYGTFDMNLHSHAICNNSKNLYAVWHFT